MEKPVAGTLLTREARDEIVVTAAAADRAEADGLAIVVFDLERQLGFEHGAGVVFEAADDAKVRLAIAPIAVTGSVVDLLHQRQVQPARSLRRSDYLQFRACTCTRRTLSCVDRTMLIQSVQYNVSI